MANSKRYHLDALYWLETYGKVFQIGAEETCQTAMSVKRGSDQVPKRNDITSSKLVWPTPSFSDGHQAPFPRLSKKSIPFGSSRENLRHDHGMLRGRETPTG